VRHLLREGDHELVVRVASGLELPPEAAVAPTAADLESYKTLDPVYAVRSLEAYQVPNENPAAATGRICANRCPT
jgi:hypothetical protein